MLFCHFFVHFCIIIDILTYNLILLTKGYEEKNLDEKVFRIYENIYNQELNYKNSIDSKFTSRFTILISFITAVSIVFYTFF